MFPGQQGGPLEHVIAGEGGGLQDRRRAEEFKERQERTLDGARILAERLVAARRRRGRDHRADRRHRRAPGPGRPARLRAGRPAGRGPAAPDRHHRQPQRRAVRPAPADGHLRPADRHPGAGHPRLRRRGLPEVADIIAAALRHDVRRRHPRPACRPGRHALVAASPAVPARWKGPDSDRRPSTDPRRRGRRGPTCPSTPTSSGATPSRSRPTTSSSSAAAATGSRPRTTWPRTTASPTSRCWRRAGWPAATWPATRRSSAPTTCGTRAPASTSTRSSCGSGWTEDLDYPILFSQRGVLNLAHSLQDVRDSVRRVNANQLNGIDAEWLDAAAGQGALPDRQHLAGRALPGARRHLPAAGRHRQARLRRLGVRPRARTSWAWTSSRTARSPASTRPAAGSPACGRPAAPSAPGRVALVRRRAHLASSRRWSGSGCRIQSHPLQALVSELLEPVHPTVVMSNAVHVYVSPGAQGRAGDGCRHRLLQRLRPARRVPRHRAADGRRARAVPDLRPGARAADLGRHRRHHPGRVADRRPHARSRTCTSTAAGAPAASRRTPGVGWCFAAHDRRTARPHPLDAPFTLERFTTGALVDEHGAAAVAH